MGSAARYARPPSCQTGRLEVPPLERGKRLFQIGDEIVDRLDADRQADEVAGNDAVGSFDRFAVLRETFHTAKRGGRNEDFERSGETAGGCLITLILIDIMPPKPPVIWRRAMSWPGWDGKPG